MTDAALISLLTSGDSKAFTFLYKKYFGMAEWYITHNSGTKQDTEDVFQDALVAFYEKSLDPNFELSSTIKTYLYSIIRNLWLKKLRDQRIKLTEKNFEEVLILEEELESDDEERYLEIEEALKKLGEKCQSIITQFYYYRKKMTEIAEQLGYTNAANAKNQKYKCMQQLKQLLNHG